MIILKENETKDFNSEAEMLEYVEDRKKYDKWYDTFISDMQLITCENDDTENFKRKYNIPLKPEKIEKCIKDTNMFLVFYTEINGEKKRGVAPLRDTALPTILNRAEISGFSMLNEEVKPGIDRLTLKQKCEIINNCLKLYKLPAKVLYTDERVGSVMSGKYSIILDSDIVMSASETVRNIFDEVKYVKGSASHRHFQSVYEIVNKELQEDIALAINDAGGAVNDVKVHFSVYSNNIGTSGIHLFLYTVIDNAPLFLGMPKSVKHLGNNGTKEIDKQLKKLCAAFEENAEALKKLPETVIYHPAGCLRKIGKEFHLPRKIIMELAEELELKAETTAYEIYWYLNEAARRYEAANNDMKRILVIQSAVAETLTINYKKFDKEFEWARGENVDEM